MNGESTDLKKFNKIKQFSLSA